MTTTTHTRLCDQTGRLIIAIHRDSHVEEHSLPAPERDIHGQLDYGLTINAIAKSEALMDAMLERDPGLLMMEMLAMIRNTTVSATMMTMDKILTEARDE